MLSARGAQSRVAKTAGFDGARVDRSLLDGRVGVQQVWEVVRPAAVMGGDEAGVKCSPDGAGAVQAAVVQPAPAEDIPGKCGLCPLPAKLAKPGTGLRGFADLVTKAPLCGRLIEALRDPLDDYEGAAGSEQFANVVKHRGGICDVVERKAGDDGIQRGIWHVVPEGDPPVSRSSRRFGIDAQGVVAGVKKGRDMAAGFPAAELDDPGRWFGQVLADERPGCGEPDLIGGTAAPWQAAPSHRRAFAHRSISFRSWRTPGERRDLIESPGGGLGVLISGR